MSSQPPPANTSPVYTFLATLVLLLSVSAAIVIRSFMLRRRHRRLVEEAIRNGTWVPPPPPTGGPGGRAPRVDLSKKPIMWDAYLGSNSEKDLGGNYGGYEEPRDWDAIKPVSAAYLAPAVKAEPGASKTVADQPTPNTHWTRNVGQTLQSGARWFFGFPPRPAFTPSSNASQVNVAGAAADNVTPAQPPGTPPACGPDGGPPVVRVAVIIAMPRPPKPGHALSSSIPPTASSSTPASSALSPTQDHPLSQQHPSLYRPPNLDDDEEPLPVMEMGVAELSVVDHDAEASREAMAAIGAKDPLSRDSSSLTMEA
ncbi:hypothetical protein CC2G_002426 [Coprinopsis cinerea AmutBmut pab1-1]|nr:hypothetical protein CC2G_002426 [Coprinopsis cinerea AmutBmut pab1-1]